MVGPSHKYIYTYIHIYILIKQTSKSSTSLDSYRYIHQLVAATWLGQQTVAGGFLSATSGHKPADQLSDKRPTGQFGCFQSS